MRRLFLVTLSIVAALLLAVSVRGNTRPAAAAPTAAPNAPSNLTSGIVTSSTIPLAWVDNSADEDNFVVGYSRTTVSNWVFTNVAADSTSYIISGLTPGTSYYVYVKACNTLGCSNWSNGLTVTTAGTATATPTPSPSPTATATPTATGTPRPPTMLPARFSGTLTLFGKKASGSVTLSAYVGNTVCGTTTVKSGVYAVNVTAALDLPGCGQLGTPVAFKVGDYWANETGTWKMGEPQTIDLTGPRMTNLALTPGCNNQVTITFSNKTPTKTLRAAVDPTASLTGIWKWNAKAGQWDGDFPGAPDSVNTLKTVDRLDTLWICVSAPAALAQPSAELQ